MTPLFTQAIKEAACPLCGEQPGDPCLTPGLKKAKQPHQQRVLRYIKAIGYDKARKRHTIKIKKAGVIGLGGPIWKL